MLSRSSQQRSQTVPPTTPREEQCQQSLGIIDAFFLSIGFTTGNFFQFITPIAKGGLGLTVTTLGAVIGTFVAVGLSTILITVISAYSFLYILKPSDNENKTLINKQKEVEEKYYLLWARILYLWHLLKDSPNNERLKQEIKTMNIEDQFATLLINNVGKIYALAQQDIIQNIKENPHISAEESIKNYLWTNKSRFSHYIKESFADFYIPKLLAKNHRPEIIGGIAGLICFMNISSGFLGAYSSVLALVAMVSTVSLTVPIVGWAFFATSLLFGVAMGLAARRLTQKAIKRQNAIADMQSESDKLTQILLKNPCVKILQQHLINTENKAKLAEDKMYLAEIKLVAGKHGTAQVEHKTTSTAESAMNPRRFALNARAANEDIKANPMIVKLKKSRSYDSLFSRKKLMLQPQPDSIFASDSISFARH